MSYSGGTKYKNNSIAINSLFYSVHKNRSKEQNPSTGISMEYYSGKSRLMLGLTNNISRCTIEGKSQFFFVTLTHAFVFTQCVYEASTHRLLCWPTNIFKLLYVFTSFVHA